MLQLDAQMREKVLPAVAPTWHTCDSQGQIHVRQSRPYKTAKVMQDSQGQSGCCSSTPRCARRYRSLVRGTNSYHHSSQMSGIEPYAARCRANMAHIGQSRPGSGLGVQVKGVNMFKLFSLRSEHIPVFPSSLGSSVMTSCSNPQPHNLFHEPQLLHRNVQSFGGGLVFTQRRSVKCGCTSGTLDSLLLSSLELSDTRA
jgi:hypothetical protein